MPTLITKTDASEIKLEGAPLIEFLKTKLTGRDLANFMGVNKAWLEFILTTYELNQKYWKTRTRHYFYNINTQYRPISDKPWESRFRELEAAQYQDMSDRSRQLFLALTLNNLEALQPFQLTIRDLYHYTKLNISLYHIIAKNRHPAIMKHIFDTVILPFYTSKKNNHIIRRKKDVIGYTLFHHGAMLNRPIISAKEKITPIITRCLTTCAEHVIQHDPNYSIFLTPLHLAARCGSMTAIEAWVTVCRISPDLRRDDANYTPLHEAARAGHCGSIATLLALGAHIDIKAQFSHNGTPFIITPLALAALYGHFKAFHLLIQAGAERSNLLLYFATIGGNIKIINALGDMPNILVNAISDDKETPLHLAAMNGDDLAFKKLLALGANPNALTPNKCTLFHCAVIGDNLLIVEFIFNKIKNFVNVDVNTKNEDGETPLHLAIINNVQSNIVRTLLANKADVNATQNEGETPLHYACHPKANNPNFIQTLIDHGATIDAVNNKKATPLERLLRIYQQMRMQKLALFIKNKATLTHPIADLSSISFSELKVPLHFLLSILRKTPNIIGLNLIKCEIIIDPNHQDDLMLERGSLKKLKTIVISHLDVFSVLLLNTILGAAAPDCIIQPAMLPDQAITPEIDQTIQHMLAERDAEKIRRRSANTASPSTHTTLFSHPKKRATASKNSASKHVKNK